MSAGPPAARARGHGGPVTAELETYARELSWILDQVCESLAGLSAAQLNWRPATRAANSPYTIARHIVASTRVYALGFGCGHAVQRDRDAEFIGSAPDPGEVMDQLRQLEQEIRGAVAALGPAALDERLVPPQELWGTGRPREISRREALVESIRHAAIHLGELRLTRSLAVEARSTGARDARRGTKEKAR
jgi:hypothetical protein